MRFRSGIAVAFLFLAVLCADDASQGVFSGNEHIGEQRLLEYLSERDVDPADPGSQERAERLIRLYYHDHGFPLARVRRAGGRLHIEEGPRAKLGWVDFQGNEFFSDQELSDALDVEGTLDFDRLEQGLDRIRQRYRDSGFYAVNVQRTGLEVVEVEETTLFPLPFQKAARHRIRLTVEVREGARYRFGHFPLPNGLDGLDLPAPIPGEIYSEARLESFRMAVGRHFASSGRLIREFQIEQRISPFGSRVDHRVRFALFPPMDVRFIRFEGNENYPDAFYRRELEFEESRLFDPRLVAKSLRNINSTGVLKRPLDDDDVELDIDDRLEVVDVTIRLQEKKRRGFFHTLSRGDFGGLQSRVLLTVANSLGLGEELGLEVEHGGGVTGAALGLTSRYLLGTDIPLGFGLRFFRRHTGVRLAGVDEGIESIFRSRETGLSGVGAYRIRHGNEVGSQFSFSWLTRPPEARTGRMVLSPFWAWSEGGEQVWHDEFRLSSRFSFFADNAQAFNWRPSLEYLRTGREAPDGGRFAFRFQASHSRFGSGEPLLSDRLFTDSDTIRGFSGTTSGPWGFTDQGRLGPLGGDTLIAFNSEYEMPLNDTFSVAPFLDSGVNFSLRPVQGFRVAEATNRVWRASVGGEFRFKLPGPLPAGRIIAAWNPLRMADFATEQGGALARLRDPRASLRLAFDPVF